MVKVIIINTQGDLVKAVKTLGRIKKRLPKMTRLAMRRWGKILARDMYASARQAMIQSSSGAFYERGVRYSQGKRSDTGYLFIRVKQVMLDGMAPHYANVTARRSGFLAWARMARSLRIRRGASEIDAGIRTKFGVYVKPHPFIAGGYRRARPKLRGVLKRLGQRAISGT